MCTLYGIRYHIITLIAVFLALGLGLLLGGTLGEQWLVKEQAFLLQRLEERYTQAQSDNANLHKQTTAMELRTRQLEQTTAQVSGHYVQDRLVGQKVAILQLEPTDIKPLESTLQQAGANLISTVQFTSAATASTSHLGQMADRLVQELYLQQDRSLVRDLQQSNAVTVSGTLGIKPTHVIVIGGSHQQTRSRILLFDTPLLQALSKHGLHAVVAELSTTQQSGIRDYRELGISTVDNVDQETGRIALVDLLCGANGDFGTKKTAQALLPNNTKAKEVSTQP